MIRSRLARFLGFALALTAGFATPASALAHGHAHEHEAEEHAAADDVTHAERRAHNQVNERGHVPDVHAFRALKSADRDAGDHPHSSVGAALITKTVAPLFVLVATCVALPSARVVTLPPPLPERALQFRVEAAHAPPPHLRAPPSVLG